MVKSALRVSLESFVFIHFPSTVQSNYFCWTSNHLIPIFFSTNTSKKAKSLHQKSILNSEKAFNFWNFHVAKLKFVYDVSDCRKCLTFDTGRFLAFDKLRADPEAAAPGVYNLGNFCCSKFEEDPAFASLWFCHSNSQQTWRFLSSARLIKVNVENICFWSK